MPFMLGYALSVRPLALVCPVPFAVRVWVSYRASQGGSLHSLVYNIIPIAKTDFMLIWGAGRGPKGCYVRITLRRFGRMISPELIKIRIWNFAHMTIVWWSFFLKLFHIISSLAFELLLFETSAKLFSLNSLSEANYSTGETRDCTKPLNQVHSFLHQSKFKIINLPPR